MKKEQNSLPWIVAGIALVACAGLAWSMYDLRDEFTRVNQRLASASMERQTAPAPAAAAPTQPQTTWKTANAFYVPVNGTLLEVAYQCSGTVNVTHFSDIKPAAYCIGPYQLVATNILSGKQAVLEHGTAQKAEDSPVLLSAENISSLASKTSNILIAFPVTPCSTIDDCYLGMPNNYENFVLQADDFSFHMLGQLPPSGKLLWNAAGTKALVYPYTCGGAGCDVAPIRGYNLLADKLTDVTLDQAAGSVPDADMSLPGTMDFASSPREYHNPQGDAIPFWTTLTWSDDSTFYASMHRVDGVTKQIKGSF